jgi:outer membrane lipoprotein-sorting protein
MKKIIMILFFFGAFFSWSFSYDYADGNDAQEIVSQKLLRGSYVLSSFVFEEKRKASSDEGVRSLFAYYKDGRRKLRIDKNNKLDLTVDDIVKSIFMVVDGDELFMYFPKSNQISLNGGLMEGVSYTIYEYKETPKGFIISREDPLVREKYIFVKK